MQKTGTKILYGFKELAGNPIRCACTGGERASAGRTWQGTDGKAGKRTYHTVLVAIPIGTYQKCRLKRPKGMVPYGGKNKPVRFSGMWETVVGSKSPYGICIRSPVRWFVNNRTVYMDM